MDDKNPRMINLLKIIKFMIQRETVLADTRNGVYLDNRGRFDYTFDSMAAFIAPNRI